MVVLVALASLAVAGTVERPAPGGVFREAEIGQPLSLNPLLDPQDPILADISRLAFAGLVRVLDGGRIEGDLADRWTTTDAGSTYSFHLRDGAQWQDGQPVTPADVLTTVAILQSPDYPGPAGLAAVWRSVHAEAVDSRTIRFRLDRPYSSFIEACSIPLLPSHLFRPEDAAGLRDHPASYQPVGAGPFRIAEVNLAGLRLVRFDGYAGVRPYLAEVDLNYYPDLGAAASALRDGQVDGLLGLRPSQLGALRDQSGYLVQTLTLTQQQITLYLNQRNAILGDRRVRQAIELGVDRARALGESLPGDAAPAFGPIAASSWAYSDLVELSPDPFAARSLLDTAGWLGSSFRVQGSRTLHLRLSVPLDDGLIALAERIKAQLQAIGFQIDLQPANELDLYRERIGPRAYDLALLRVWLGSIDPDPYPLWHSSQARTGFNFAAYERAETDLLLEAARADGDSGRRRSALEAFQRLWLEDVPSVVLANPIATYVTGRQFHGVRLGITPEPSARFQHVAEWYVQTERVPAFWH